MEQEVQVKIRGIAVGGAGVGEVMEEGTVNVELHGITAFVPFSAPGESVRAKVIDRKERYLKTELLSVVSESPARVTPECEYFAQCGGCELQHISYHEQLRIKDNMIQGALKAGRLGIHVLEALKPLHASSSYHYRRRVTLHVDQGGRVGFYRENSRSVVPISSCTVSVEQIDAALTDISELGKKLKGKISSVLLECDLKDVVAVLKTPYDLSLQEAREVLDAAKEHFSNVTIVAAEKEILGTGRKILELPLNDSRNFTLQVPAGSFSQVNGEINIALIKRVLELAAIKREVPVYDLYAGAGNFTLPLARAGGVVTAVECDSRLAFFGRENAKRNGLGSRIDYVEQSVEKFLAAKRSHPKDLLVLADPPRSGLGHLVPEFDFASRLLLISCHLPSLVRDLKALSDRGWKVETIEPFDMFAQTSYVETLAYLKR